MQYKMRAGFGWKQALAAMCLLLMVTGVYWPGLYGPFLFDDFQALVNNRAVHVQALNADSLWQAAMSFAQIGSGRPLVMASFALNHALGGLDPWGWKLGGLLVHLLNALLVYLLCLRLLVLAGVTRCTRLSAAGLAVAWAVHPLQVSAVLYVVQRMETLCLTFVLLGLLAYLRGRSAQMAGNRGWPWLALCALSVLLSLGSKETGVLMPLYTLALELTLLGFAGATVGQRRFWRWGYVAGALVGLVLYALVLVPHYATAENFAIRDYSAWERVLSQLRILPMYLAQILLPLPANMPFYYDHIQASTSLLSPPATLWGGLLLVLLMGAAWGVRRRAPMAALGVFWFFAAHAMTSNVISLELVFEHRNYFALLGVLLVLAEIVRRIPTRDGPGIKIAGVVAIILALGFLGAVRSATWGNSLLLATELATINPQSPRAAQDLGILYHAMADGSPDSPFFHFAVRELERQSAMPHASVLGEQSLILLHASHGLTVQPLWWEKLHQRLRERAITPQTTGAMFALLQARMKGTAMDDAALGDAFLIMFNKVEFPPFSYALLAGHARDYRDDRALSDSLLRSAVDRAVEHPDYVGSLAGQLVEQGHPDQAALVLAYARQQGIIL